MRKDTKGFTIVELLIVIVVIGILAAITIVAYNGIQTRAKNVKTVNAATQWVKAFKLYYADKGTWPNDYSCLGTTNTYVGNGGQCWNSASWVVKPSFLTMMQPYISNYPEPDTTNIASTNSPRRGLMYDTDTSTYWAMYMFQIGPSVPCPNIGVTAAGPFPETTGYYCIYYINT